MRKYINNILTTTIEGLIVILSVLVIIGVIVVCALIILGIVTTIFGEHDFWLLRLCCSFAKDHEKCGKAENEERAAVPFRKSDLSGFSCTISTL